MPRSGLNSMESSGRFGLSCALALPFNDDAWIDYRLLAAHARSTLDAGCSSVTVFGTTGEGASVSMGERSKMLGALLSTGIDPRAQIVGGIAAASIGDAIEQIRILSDSGCGVILYHIPSVTQVPLSVDLIRRLKATFPGVIIGVKDSGGNWPFTESLLSAHSDLAILIGDERHLAAGVRLGAKGAISGLANLCAPVLDRK